MSNILIIGASRGIGLETVKAALAAGHTVRAFSRHASQIAVENPKLEKIDGDALQSDDIERVLDGTDCVIQVLGLAMGADYFKGTTLFSDATRVLTEAMNAAGVKRLIAVTGLGAGDSRGHGGLLYDALVFPVLLKRIYDDKDIQEQIIKRSDLDWTIVRPGILRDGPASGLYRALTDKSEWRPGNITRADVAEFLIDELERPSYIHETPLLIT